MNPIPSHEATAELSDERLKELGYAFGDRNNRFIDIPLMRAAIAADRAQFRPPTPAADQQTEREPIIRMRPMDYEDGRRGYYVDHPDFYADVEPDEQGVWSVFFRFKDGKEAFGEPPTACFAGGSPARDVEAPAAINPGSDGGLIEGEGV